MYQIKIQKITRPEFVQMKFSEMPLRQPFIWKYKSDAQSPYDADGCEGVKLSSNTWLRFDDLALVEMMPLELDKPVYLLKVTEVNLIPVLR